MKFVIFVLLMLLAIMLLIAYSLVVMAHEADKRAERMYRKWKERPKELDILLEDAKKKWEETDERNGRSDTTR